MSQNEDLYILGLICARGGSKGIRRKNIRSLAGKPLITYAIDVASQCNYLSRLIVSTEDTEIATVARKYHADVPFMRPHALAKDDSPEWLVWQHAIDETERITKRKVDIIVSIPTTAPLRNVGDVDNCVEKLLQSDVDGVITVCEAERNPYFNMVAFDGGYAKIAFALKNPIFRRQDAPKIYNITTVAYAAHRDFVMSSKGFFEGNVGAVEVPRERSLDLDTELDFEFAEFLLKRALNTAGKSVL